MTPSQLFMLSLFPALMAYSAFSDLVSMRISNRISLVLVAGFVVAAIGLRMPLAELGLHLAAGSLVLAICFGMFAAGWIGGGDAKLAASTALWVGWFGLLEYVVVSSVLGGMLTIALLSFRSHPLPHFARWPWLLRLHHHKTGIPYGIALAVAGLTIYPETALWKLAVAA
jgi:prepilin peptidase CpaA